MKTCPKCSSVKSLEEFSRKPGTKDGRSHHCKSCANVLNKLSRERNKELYLAGENRRRQTKRDKLAAYKAERGCLMCPENNPVCLDLHHLDPSVKDDTVSHLLSRASWERVEAEIAKCVVVCRNCHAKHHHDGLELNIAEWSSLVSSSGS